MTPRTTLIQTDAGHLGLLATFSCIKRSLFRRADLSSRQWSATTHSRLLSVLSCTTSPPLPKGGEVHPRSILVSCCSPTLLSQRPSWTLKGDSGHEEIFGFCKLALQIFGFTLFYHAEHNAFTFFKVPNSTSSPMCRLICRKPYRVYHEVRQRHGNQCALEASMACRTRVRCWYRPKEQNQTVAKCSPLEFTTATFASTPISLTISHTKCK